MSPLAQIAKKIQRSLAHGTREEGFYGYLEDLIGFISSVSEDLGIYVYVSPSKSEGGFPDIQLVREHDNLHLGFIEVKLPGDDLRSDGRYKTQFNNYKESSENLIITDMKRWELWQWNSAKVSQQKMAVVWDFEAQPNKYSELRKLLERFVENEPMRADDPEQLAEVLARRNKRLAEVVEEVFNNVDCPENLTELYKTIQEYLVKDIDVHDYVNMFSETITYSLFIARLQHFKRGETEEFNSTNALNYLRGRLPRVPLLDEIYYKANADLLERIKAELDLIVQDLRLCDIKKIYEQFTKHDPDKDPIIYFYEPFVKYNDPEIKMKRGVFYTPKPIADFITRSVNLILKDPKHFGLENGLAHDNVHLLDPAVGTGTFILSAVEAIFGDLKKKFKGQTPEYISRKMNIIIQKHILERFYGFEVMMAPYAIAHLKLSMLLEELGYKFELSDHNKQFKVYLTNSLENDEHQPSLFYGQIANEGKAASKIKNEAPVLAIIGNPPYANFGQMNVNNWIQDLLKDYKKNLGERKVNLDDDFIKFIRFAQWKLDQTGQGVFAMITNNTFIDGVTHRQMRKSLLETFDEIYICNLHGNSRKGEICPDGSKDENVFDIQVGVSINIFIKHELGSEKAIVKYADFWGLREDKLKRLARQDFDAVAWVDVDYETFNKKFASTNWGKAFASDLNFFSPKSTEKILEYGDFWGINEIFKESGSGIITRNDDATIYFSKQEISQVLKDFQFFSENEIRQKYNIKDGVSWKLRDAIRDVKAQRPTSSIQAISYHPFDFRYTYLTDRSSGFLNRPIYDVMRHMKMPNIGLSTTRNQIVGHNNFLATRHISNTRYSSKPGSIGADYLYPLYLYDQIQASNITEEFNTALANMLQLDFVDSGQGDLIDNFGPEDIFYYIYSIFHSDMYRNSYNELFNFDYPRIPLVADRQLFAKLIHHGKRLVELHLLNENPFGINQTSILNKPSDWHVRIGSDDGKLNDLKITRRKYIEDRGRIYINTKTFFEGIGKEVWEYCMGGYQVLDKWLNSRNCRELNDVEIDQFMKIVVALRETLDTMSRIDPLVIQLLKTLGHKLETPKTGRKQRRQATVAEIKKKTDQPTKVKSRKRPAKKAKE